MGLHVITQVITVSIVTKYTKTPDPVKTPGVSEASAAPFRGEDAATKRAKTLKVRRIGNSLGVVLPKDMLESLGVAEGDQLGVSVTPDGLVLKPYDERLQEQIDAARRAMHRYRNALRELAK